GALGRAIEAGALVVGDRVEAALVVPGAQAAVFEALVRPETWWAQKVEGALEPGTDAVMDFGPFGRIAIHTVSVQAPAYLAYRWVQGTADPMQRLGDARGPASTLGELRTEDAPEGTRVRVVESGVEARPVEDVATHFTRAHQAWGIILGLLEGHFRKR